jgi:HEAT repeat protein
MDSPLRNFLHLLNTALLMTAIVAAVTAGASLIFLFLMAGRAWQHFRTRRLEALSLRLHAQWRAIVRGEISAAEWRNSPARCEIVETIVVQEIGAATDKDRAGLQEFLRASGLLNRCILRVERSRGWRRRRAMLALGEMRVVEAIAPISEGLLDRKLETRAAAVQALGSTGLAAAAEPIIEDLMLERLNLPADPVTNALVRCFMHQPEAVLPSLRRSNGKSREILAHVASEIATTGMAEEMILLAEDALPEVRACAARALAVAPPALAIPALASLVRDDAWFVRLRAVTALNQISNPRVIPALLEAVRDPYRLVRVRAAAALARFEQEIVEILQHVVDSRDRYALHALISALDIGGSLERVAARLADPSLRDVTAAFLLKALREGSAQSWSTRPADTEAEPVLP